MLIDNNTLAHAKRRFHFRICLRMHRATFITGLLVLGIISVALVNESQATALDDYVRVPDPHFNWTLIETYSDPDYMLYILNFTSQKWFDGKLEKLLWDRTIDCFSVLETFSTRPIWWHYLCITVPYVIKRPNAAFMLIDGGTNRDG